MGVAIREVPVDLPLSAPTAATESALQGPAFDILVAAWRELAAGNVDTGDYVAHLTRARALNYPYLGDPFVMAAINTAVHAIFVDEGHAGFHLASRWTNWKISKDGKRYARVRFRIGTPGAEGEGMSSSRQRSAMPADIYARARTLQSGDRLTGLGDLYRQSKSYRYYQQVFADFPELLKDAPGYTWSASPFEGMRHVNEPTPGGGSQAWFETFRTITPESMGWYVPPSPAHHFGQRALETAAPAIEQILAEAAAVDAAAALEAATEDLV